MLGDQHNAVLNKTTADSFCQTHIPFYISLVYHTSLQKQTNMTWFMLFDIMRIKLPNTDAAGARSGKIWQWIKIKAERKDRRDSEYSKDISSTCKKDVILGQGVEWLLWYDSRKYKEVWRTYKKLIACEVINASKKCFIEEFSRCSMTDMQRDSMKTSYLKQQEF